MVFGQLSDGREVDAITIASDQLSATVLTYGAILHDLRLKGVEHALTVTPDTVQDYETTHIYHGRIIGPIANRISTGRVRIEGMMHELERNQDRRIHLHSGSKGLHARLWQVRDQSETAVTLQCTLMDGDCGLPGNRDISVTFRVDGPSLTLEFHGTTDAQTLMNIANHSYWNLDGSDTWDGHRLQIDADAYLPTDKDCCPTGDVAGVADTDMDFRQPRAISPNAPAFDTNFCTSDGPADLRDVLTLTVKSGVSLTMATDQAGVQIYDGRDDFSPDIPSYKALAIEAQGWPDAPSHRHFPSILVTPETGYRQTTRFTFAKP